MHCQVFMLLPIVAQSSFVHSRFIRKVTVVMLACIYTVSEITAGAEDAAISSGHHAESSYGAA